jgi:molybdopterin synthase sulfur carrier subunit
MGPRTGASAERETDAISVRLWAAAKAAAGIGALELTTTEALTLAEVVERVLSGRPERLAPVLAGCSVLVGDRPVSTLDPADVVVRPGDTVEFLPPFAGG